MKLQDGKAALLFRFHTTTAANRERLKILRHFNPNLPIYGLFGGDSEADFIDAKNEYTDLIENLWFFKKDKPRSWKWIHADVMVKEWFREIGHSLDFDFLYSYEYDILTLKPLIQLYPNIESDSIALSALTELNKVETAWDWTNSPARKPAWLEFKEYMRKTYGLEKQTYMCQGPGPLFPKKFLNKFAATEDNELVIEEITMPAYAEVLGFKLVDNGLHPGFYVTPESKFFNCYTNYFASVDEFLGELSNPQGRRAFHPIKGVFTLEQATALGN